MRSLLDAKMGSSVKPPALTYEIDGNRIVLTSDYGDEAAGPVRRGCSSLAVSFDAAVATLTCSRSRGSPPRSHSSRVRHACQEVGTGSYACALGSASTISKTPTVGSAPAARNIR